MKNYRAAPPNQTRKRAFYQDVNRQSQQRPTFGQQYESEDPLSAVLFGSAGSSCEFKAGPINSVPSMADSTEPRCDEFKLEQSQKDAKRGMLTSPFTGSDEELLMKGGNLNTQGNQRPLGSIGSIVSDKFREQEPQGRPTIMKSYPSNREGTVYSSNYTTRSLYTSPVGKSIKRAHNYLPPPTTSLVTTLSPSNSVTAPQKHLSPTLKSLRKVAGAHFSPNFPEVDEVNALHASVASMRSSDDQVTSTEAPKQTTISELKNLLAETLEENKNLKDRVLHFESSKDVNQKQGKRSIKRGKTIDKVRSMHTSPSHSKLIHARERLATTAPQHRRHAGSKGSQSFSNLHDATNSSFNHTLSIFGEEDVKKLQGQVRSLREQASNAELENLRLCEKGSALQLQLHDRDKKIQSLQEATKGREEEVERMRKEIQERELYIQGQKAELIEMQNKHKEEEELKRQLPPHSEVASTLPRLGNTVLSSPTIATPLYTQLTPALSHIDLAQRIREARLKGSTPIIRDPAHTVDEQLIALANNYAFVSKNLQRQLELQKKLVKEKTLLLIESEKREHANRKELQKRELKIAMLRNERAGLRQEVGKLKEAVERRDQKHKTLRAKAIKKLKVKGEQIAGLRKLVQVYEHSQPSQRSQPAWLYPFYPQGPPPPPQFGQGYLQQQPYHSFSTTPGVAMSFPGGTPVIQHDLPPGFTQLPSPDLSRIGKVVESVDPLRSLYSGGDGGYVSSKDQPTMDQPNQTFNKQEPSSAPQSEVRTNRRAKSADFPSSTFMQSPARSEGGRKKTNLVQQRLDALLREAASLTKYSKQEDEDEDDELCQDYAESRNSPLRKLLQQRDTSPIIEETSSHQHSSCKTNLCNPESGLHVSYNERGSRYGKTGVNINIERGEDERDERMKLSVSVLEEPPAQYSFSKQETGSFHPSTPERPLRRELSSMEEQVRYLQSRRETIERDLIQSEPRLSASGGTHSALSTPNRPTRR